MHEYGTTPPFERTFNGFFMAHIAWVQFATARKPKPSITLTIVFARAHVDQWLTGDNARVGNAAHTLFGVHGFLNSNEKIQYHYL
jgi:hypothetical protein